MAWLSVYGPAVAAVALVVAAVWLWHPVRARLADRRNRNV